jgi:hypothetical protein
MALDGIGGGSPLERFQAIRDSAKKKIEGADGQANLADLIKRKQAQLAGAQGAGGKMEVGGGASSPASGNAAKASAERIRPGLGAAVQDFGSSASAGSRGIPGPTGYGRAGALQKQESRPTLGRHVDFMA